MHHTNLEIFDLIEKANKLLEKYGYFHHYSYYYHGKGHFKVSFVDENKYRCKEFGNLTTDKAFYFLAGLTEGLALGLLDPEE